MTASPMTVPTIPTITAGSIVTATELNQLSYAAAFLMSKPMTRVYDSSGGQSLSNAGATSESSPWSGYTAIKFNNKNFDVDGAWPGSGTSDNELIIQTPGWYKFRYSVNLAIDGNGPCNAGVISTSGSNNPSGSGNVSAICGGSFAYSASIAYLSAAGIFPLYLYTGDNLQVIAISSSGTGTVDTGIGTISGGISATLNPGSSFSIEWVSAG